MELADWQHHWQEVKGSSLVQSFKNTNCSVVVLIEVSSSGLETQPRYSGAIVAQHGLLPKHARKLNKEVTDSPVSEGTNRTEGDA